MSFRPGMPDHIRKAILSGDRELLSRAGAKGARKRQQARTIVPKPKVGQIDGKSRGAGERD